MSEKFIPTPSTEFSNASTRRDIVEGIPAGEKRTYSLLEAEEAAYAAKPFMDVAVELYNAQEDETKELALQNSGLPSLIDYAERRARLATEKGEVPELSDDEQKILDVYKSQSESDKVKTDLGGDYLDLQPEDAISASIEAEDRFKQATTREEKSKWSNMGRKLERYADYLKSGNDDQYEEFSTSTTHVAGLLDRMSAETGEVAEWDGEPLDRKKLLLQVHNLRAEAEMLRFVGDHTDFKHGENNADQEAPKQGHELYYDVVGTVPEAKELIYSNPDYLTELVDESEAYAKFSSGSLDTSNAATRINIKIMERDLPEVRQAVQDWRTTESGMNFKQYIQAVAEGDINATQEQRNAAGSARLMMRNMFWREPSMVRRMAKKQTDKSEVGDINKAFGAEYFSRSPQA